MSQSVVTVAEVDRVFVRVLLGVDGRCTYVAVDVAGGRFDWCLAVDQLDADELVGGNGGMGTTDPSAAVNARCDRGTGDAVRLAVEAVHEFSSMTTESSVGAKKRWRAQSAT
jgi:hypothetical protein